MRSLLGLRPSCPTQMLVTPMAMAFGVVFLGDNVTWRMVVGGVVVLAGVLVIVLRARPTTPPPPDPI